jgi:hypothetical protein
VLHRRVGILSIVVVGAPLGGCDGLSNDGVGGLATSDYLAADLADAWTWRDDVTGDATGDTGGGSEGEDEGDSSASVDADTVLRGRMDDAGLVDVRRGSRWPDGSPVGSLTWDRDSDDIVLVGWAWSDADGPSAGSDSPTVMAVSGGRDGDSTTSGEGACVMTRVEPLATTYGTFEAALQCVCEGTPAPDGTYWFAANFGLVKAETSAFTLDLVAPW